MITIIMLTSIALITLLIGFFEIRIPFIHKMQSFKEENGIEKNRKPGKTQVKILKGFLKNPKSEFNYRFLHTGKTSDIASS